MLTMALNAKLWRDGGSERLTENMALNVENDDSERRN